MCMTWNQVASDSVTNNLVWCSPLLNEGKCSVIMFSFLPGWEESYSMRRAVLIPTAENKQAKTVHLLLVFSFSILKPEKPDETSSFVTFFSLLRSPTKLLWLCPDSKILKSEYLFPIYFIITDSKIYKIICWIIEFDTSSQNLQLLEMELLSSFAMSLSKRNTMTVPT